MKKVVFTEILHHLLEEYEFGEKTLWVQLLWHQGPARKVRVQITRQFLNKDDEVMVGGFVENHTKWSYMKDFRFELNTLTGVIEYFAS